MMWIEACDLRENKLRHVQYKHVFLTKQQRIALSSPLPHCKDKMIHIQIVYNKAAQI